MITHTISEMLILATSLTVTQSLTEYDIGDKTYQEMVDACAANILNGRLAYESEILAYLAGPVGGDVWTPVADEYNEWLQIGGSGPSGWDYGVLHSDVGSGTEGALPSWGTDEERLSNWGPSYWQNFYCEVDVSGCSSLLAVTQSLTEYDIGDKTYQELSDACAGNIPNGRLAYESEVLAYLAGPIGGDVWTPVADEYNEWLQIGGSDPWDYGVLHSDVDSGSEGLPSWGTDEERLSQWGPSYWKNFYCAVDVPESTILAAGLCSEIKANSGGISKVNARVDKRIEAVNTRFNEVNTAVNTKVQNVMAVATKGINTNSAGISAMNTANTALGKRIDTLGDRIDKLVKSIQSVSDASAKSFGGAMIGGAESVSDSGLSFSRTELLLLCLNAVIIVIGLCICWRGGLFSNGQRGYSKVSPYYETEVENKPINA